MVSKRFHDSIYRNLRELSLFISYAITNSSLNRLGFGNSYILTVLIASEVDLIVPVATDSCLYVVEHCLESAIANVCLYLCFQLRIMYVKKMCIYTFRFITL